MPHKHLTINLVAYTFLDHHVSAKDSTCVRGGGKADAVVFDNVDVFCVTSCRVEW